MPRLVDGGQVGIVIVRSYSPLIIMLLVAGCAAPKPILYPNAHFKEVGEEMADRDIDDCREVAKDAGATTSQGKSGQVAGSTAGGGAIGSAAGAVGGAVVGHPGRGAMVGAASGATAGFLRGLFRRPPPSSAYKQVVQRCLKERGYDPVGWE
ncbi:MAG: glycine zipper family protein [Nitrospirota bacterium]